MTTINTSLTLNYTKYLGSKDRFLVGGNGSNGKVKIYYSEFLNGIDGKKEFFEKASVDIDGYLTSIEICGVPRLNKSYAALAGNRNDNTGFVEIYDLAINRNIASLSLNQSILQNFQSSSSISSLSYNPENEILAIGNEAGELILYDLYSNTEVFRKNLDPIGITKIKFTPSGQLIVVGNSNGPSAKLWNVRYGQNETLNFASEIVTTKEEKSMTPKSSKSSFSYSLSTFTSVAIHPTLDRAIFGTSSGSLVLWDLRTNANVEYRPHESPGNHISP